MNREQNFLSSFSSQLVTYSSWRYLPRYDAKKLPTAAFTAFSIDLGRTKYTKFNPLGKAIAAEQELIITVSYRTMLSDDAGASHSDITNVIEQFINNPIYTPPAISSGDTYSIIRCELVDGKPLVIPYEETRFQVMMSGKYVFNLF
jgi:hypothetical protein